MDKNLIQRYTGSMQQLAYARRAVYDEGRARGLNIVEVKNGPLMFSVMLDKCLDICEMSWRGENVNFLSKPGLNGRNSFDTNGVEAQRSIMGGLFFTCGYENICAPYENYPMHGRMRTSPAEHVSVNASWIEDEYVISVSGDIREAELFGENLLLHRTIETVLGEKTIIVKDEITNEAFRDEPFMLMYHCNIGYPLLSEKSRLIIPSKNIEARDNVSDQNIETWDVMPSPRDNEEEYVYLHELASDENGDTFAAVVDDTAKKGIVIHFNKNQLPFFGQWKSTASGDYVIGLEPGNSKIYGRQYHEENNSLYYLKSRQSIAYEIRFEIIESDDEILAVDKESKNILNKEKTNETL